MFNILPHRFIVRTLSWETLRSENHEFSLKLQISVVVSIAVSKMGMTEFIFNVIIIIRPHLRTTYVNAAYSYRPSTVVCLSVCLSVCRSVCHTSEPCKNGCTDRSAFWVEDLGGPG